MHHIPRQKTTWNLETCCQVGFKGNLKGRIKSEYLAVAVEHLTLFLSFSCCESKTRCFVSNPKRNVKLVCRQAFSLTSRGKYESKERGVALRFLLY